MERGQKYYVKKAEDLVLLLAEHYHTHPGKSISTKDAARKLRITEEMLTNRVLRSVPYRRYCSMRGQEFTQIGQSIGFAEEIKQRRRKRRSVRIIIGLAIIAAIGGIFGILQYVRGCSSL